MAKTPSEANDAAPVALVFGVGPRRGLGVALARRFAAEGLKTVIVARDEKRLARQEAALRAEGLDVLAFVADATETGGVASAFDFAQYHGRLALVVFNVGANRAAPALETSPADFEALWRQNALAGFLVGREAAGRLAALGGGTLLFTGATASLRARNPFLAFASAKAALRAVAQALAREFAPKGVHVAHVVIDGVIDGDYARTNFPDFYKARGAGGRLKPDAIAAAYWGLHEQERSAWTHELDLRPFNEVF
ncbi:NAD(P)-dependent dehydrogenase (short-subunit alcohol dehydrogenase family) [Rhodoblastus acidophilus]|uniref:SDR family NAD(P)-dependent oxidoreductase n=1 Tax=Rhodoblastus acidophilus TaxID=1074 RepID=UPI00222516BF|nr:SDR family NAD(P)-dependent oxidoreductase [Rhodoblastus acidophilus]MCW2318330.1 NAD(P)-dependent dehydrogenase (short-subunit alcohol dehydrogenase family) [Rhodoblastus acidophilus]